MLDLTITSNNIANNYYEWIVIDSPGRDHYPILSIFHSDQLQKHMQKSSNKNIQKVQNIKYKHYAPIDEIKYKQYVTVELTMLMNTYKHRHYTEVINELLDKFHLD